MASQLNTNSLSEYLISKGYRWSNSNGAWHKPSPDTYVEHGEKISQEQLEAEYKEYQALKSNANI